MLCDVCYAGLTDTTGNPSDGRTEIWEVSLQEARDGARVDCTICSGLWEHISDGLSDAAISHLHGEATELPTRGTLIEAMHPPASTGDSVQSNEFGFAKAHVPNHWLDATFLSILHGNPKESRANFTFTIDFWCLSKCAYTEPQTKLCSIAKTEGLYRAIVWQISAWMQQDVAGEHRNPAMLTGGPAAQASYPSRLINLKKIGRGTFALEDTNDWEPGRDYAALSYIWGDQTKIFKCLASNVRLLKRGQPISILSENISQAMKLVADLEINYIWIDALCIIQDDDQDWERISNHMDKIYSNAILTVAMNINLSASSPLLDTLLVNLARTLWLKQLEERTLLTSQRHPCTEMTDESLFCRAWCMQERLLATRIVHILPSTVIWEGFPQEKDWIRILTLPEQVIEPTSSYREVYGWGSRAAVANIGMWPRDPSANEERAYFTEAFLEFWSALLTDYTKRQLTFQDDILTAFSAIAQRISRRTGMTYACGLWLEILPLCLVWLTVDHSTSPRRPCPDIPSWSWARWTREKSVGFTLSNERLSLLSAEPDAALGKPLRLTVCGRLAGPFDVVWLTGSNSTHIPMSRRWDGSAGVEGWLLDLIQELGYTGLLVEKRYNDDCYLKFDLDNVAEHGFTDKFWYCPATFWTFAMRCTIRGLLLRARGSDFERVGVLTSVINLSEGSHQYFDDRKFRRPGPKTRILKEATTFKLV